MLLELLIGHVELPARVAGGVRALIQTPRIRDVDAVLVGARDRVGVEAGDPDCLLFSVDQDRRLGFEKRLGGDGTLGRVSLLNVCGGGHHCGGWDVGVPRQRIECLRAEPGLRPSLVPLVDAAGVALREGGFQDRIDARGALGCSQRVHVAHEDGVGAEGIGVARSGGESHVEAIDASRGVAVYLDEGPQVIPARLALGQGEDGGEEIAVPDLPLREREIVVVTALDDGGERVELFLRESFLVREWDIAAGHEGLDAQSLSQDRRALGSVLLECAELFRVVVLEAFELSLEVGVPAVEHLSPGERIVDSVEVFRVGADRADDPQASTQRVVVVAHGADGLGGALLEDIEKSIFFQALGNKGVFREALPLRVGVTRSPEVVARLKKSVMPLLQGAGVLPYRCGISVAVGEVGCVSPESHVVVPSSPLTVWSTVAETHGSSARARSEHPRRGNDATAVATRVAQRFGGAHRPSDANPTRRPGKRLHQEALNNVHTGLV